MSNRLKPRRRAVNKTGRNKHPGAWVKLEGYVLTCPAYRSMKALPRGVYTELRRRFRGTNNGYISCSLRELAAELHCSKDSAGAALKELMAKGFIRCATPGSFHYKLRHAPTWILTEEDFDGAAPTKDFMRWEPTKEKAGPKARTSRPQKGTATNEADAGGSRTVPTGGPLAPLELNSRS